MKKAKVKVVMFANLAAIQPGLAKNAHGSFDCVRDVIYVDRALPAKPTPSRGLVLAHERAHELVYKAGVQPLMDAAQEEEFCDLYALAVAPMRAVSSVELIAWQHLFHGVAGQRAIFKRCLELVKAKDIDTALKRFVALTEGGK